jgi:predicted transposase/invertase (TIGR01784 family)
MSTHPYPPVQRALEKRRALSADEEARYWAEAREKALSDEATLLLEAREEGRDEARQEMARNLIRLGVLTDAQIARVTELTVAAISRLRTTEPH